VQAEGINSYEININRERLRYKEKGKRKRH